MAENLQEGSGDLETSSSEKPMNAETPMDPPRPPPDSKVLMKFSLKSSSSAARPPLFPKDIGQKDIEIEYVSEFDGTGRKPSNEPVKVIPALENSWRPEKRMKNIMLESDLLASTEERFETESLSVGPNPSVQYGLVKRKGPDLAAKEEDEKDRAEAKSMEGSNLVVKGEDGTVNGNGQGHGDSAGNDEDSKISFQESERRKFREEVASLPDEISMEAYENIPIEDFAEALLRGLGWEKGKPIGKNCTTVAAPMENVRRVGKEGIGAIPAPKVERVQKYRKPGEHKKPKLSVGRVVCIIAGKYSGLKGQIAEVKGDSYTIALLDGGKRTVIKKDELAEVGSLEAEKAALKLQSMKENLGSKERTREKYENKESTREESTSKSSIKEREQWTSNQKVYNDDDKDARKGEFKNRGDAYSGDRHKRKQEGNEAKGSYERRKDDESKKSQRSTSKDTKEELKPAAKAALSWLTRDIRVKVIHKTEYGGKWYLQKGCIVDVVSPNICDVRMDDGGKILQDVREEHLETALPKGGGRVLVVGGKHRGQIGRLQERIPDKGVGIVQIDETYELFTLDLDHLAEYVGVNHELEG